MAGKEDQIREVLKVAELTAAHLAEQDEALRRDLTPEQYGLAVLRRRANTLVQLIDLGAPREIVGSQAALVARTVAELDLPVPPQPVSPPESES